MNFKRGIPLKGMSIGVHVGRTKKNKLHNNILSVTRTLYPGCKAVQIFTHGPHSTAMTDFDDINLQKITASGTHVWVHSSYMTSLKKPDHIFAQLAVCDHIGASGLVIHIPKAMPKEVAEETRALVGRYKTPIILEMRALKSDVDTYETPQKLIALVDALKEQKLDSSKVGICIDTAHIYAGHAQIKTKAEAEAYLAALEPIKEYIQLLHLNGNEYDAKLRAGDKHATPLSLDDKVWGSDMKLLDTGCQVFVDWYLGQKKDIILERPFDDPGVQAFYTDLLKNTSLRSKTEVQQDSASA